MNLNLKRIWEGLIIVDLSMKLTREVLLIVILIVAYMNGVNLELTTWESISTALNKDWKWFVWIDWR